MVVASLGRVLEDMEGCWIMRVFVWEVEGMVKHWESVGTSPQLTIARVLASCAFAAADLENPRRHLLTPFQSLPLPPSRFP